MKCVQKRKNTGKASTVEAELERRQKISQSMKRAHNEGRAKGWGGRNVRSYAELFFEKVINNEFIDKNYEIEYHVGKYWIDFAWSHKKLAIEIDGKQHEYTKEKDAEKDLFLSTNGWMILRIKWKDLFKNTKFCIQIAKDFVHNATDRSAEIMLLRKKQERKMHLLKLFTKIRNTKLKDQKRLALLTNLDFSQRSSISKAGKLWNVTHTSVRRILRRNGITYRAFNKPVFQSSSEEVATRC